MELDLPWPLSRSNKGDGVAIIVSDIDGTFIIAEGFGIRIGAYKQERKNQESSFIHKSSGQV